MSSVLLAFPTMWDTRQLASCGDALRRRCDVLPLRPADADCLYDLDPVAWVDAIAARHAGHAGAIFSSSDYPGAPLAAAVAAALGWRGPTPEAILRASHKHHARRIQRAVVPEATPEFHRIGTDATASELGRLPYPLFVKPIKGAFSAHARRVDSAAALRGYLDDPTHQRLMEYYLLIFRRMTQHYLAGDDTACGFIAEGILRGGQVTVEGFVSRGRAGIIGIVDSALHPGTGSFVRFDYPSSLDAAVQTRMEDIARRVVAGHGLDDTLFNIEMTHDPQTGAIGVIEVNPRMCGQFADLYQKVDGVNSYEIALAVACGEEPPRPHRRGPFACAASFPLRIFAPSRVARAPDAARIAALESRFADALIWSECAAGDALLDFGWAEDGHSARYAVVNLGGRDRVSLTGRFEELRAALGFSFEPL